MTTNMRTSLRSTTTRKTTRKTTRNIHIHLTLLACLAAPAAACVPDADAGEDELGELSAAITPTNFAFSALQLTPSQSARASTVVTTASNNVTLEAWVRWDGGPSGQLVAYNGDTSTRGYGLYLANGAVSVLMGGRGWATCTTCVLAQGVWSHVAAVRDAGVWKIYKDGVAGAVTNATLSPNAPSSGTFFVGSTSAGTEGTSGATDEVRVWNVARTAAQLAQDRTVALMGDEPGLVAYYRLDEDTGTTSADASPGGHPLTLHGGPIWVSSGATLTTGIARGALQLTGAASARTSNVITTRTDGVTLEAWVRWDGGTALQGVVYNGNSSSSGYGIYLANGTVQILAGGRGFSTCTTCVLVAGEWTHLAAVRTSGAWQIYQDGIAQTVSSATIVPAAPSGVLSLASNPGGGERLIGALDEVRVWTIARTAQQIATASTQSLPDDQPDLAAYYRLDDGSGSIAADSAGAHPATLYNAPTWITSGAPLATVAP
jgi:Concanavalin A-like lectin/glucanases superfamily